MLASRDTGSRYVRRSVSWSNDFEASSPKAIENAELLNTVGWGWGPQPFWQGDGGSDALSRGDVTEHDYEMLCSASLRAAT